MSGPAYVVVPVQANGAQHSEPDSAKIAEAIQQSLHPEDDNAQEGRGPLNQIIANQDSLYKYISWEDPVRTLGSYFGLLGILFGAHYLPLSQWALKAGAATLGVVSVTEYASRQFGPNTFLARVRPEEYKKVPESTLNATLKDIHDLVQYAAVQAQRIIFGQDLERTFVAFLGFTALYWLIKIVPPFWLPVLGLTSLYLAPLVTSTRGREVARDAKVRAGELTTAAAEKGNVLAQGGKDKAAQLSSKAQDIATDGRQRFGNLAQSGKENATNLATQARNTASNSSQATAENARKVPEMGSNAINQAPGTVRSVTDDAVNKASQLSNSAAQTARQNLPDRIVDSNTSSGNKVPQLSGGSINSNSGNTTQYHKHASEHLGNTGSSVPGQISGERMDPYAETSIIDRPRPEI